LASKTPVDTEYSSKKPKELTYSYSAKPYNEQELQKIRDTNKSFVATHRHDTIKLVYPVDPRLKITSKVRSDYKCEFDSFHQTFLTEDYLQYTESHHLLPMAAKKNYRNVNLDCLENLVSLCPNCHRAIHYGHAVLRSKMANKLLQQRSKMLMQVGLTNRQIEDVAKVFYTCDIIW
jgi:hypothetical protein